MEVSINGVLIFCFKLSLYKKQFVSQTKICDRLDLAKQTVSNLLSSLEKKGYILRKQASDDQRMILFSLSPDGIAFFKPIKEELYRIEYETFSELTKEEREMFRKVHQKIYLSIEKKMFGEE